MSDDDWENQLDSDKEEDNKAKEDEKKKKFEGEDEVDTEKLKKEKEEQRKKEALEAQQNGRVKTQNKVDYDKKFEERQKKLGGEVDIKVDTKGKSKTQISQAQEEAQEKRAADQLFGNDSDDDGLVQKAVKLNSEKDYKDFGKSTADILYKGKTPYRVENFFRELCKDLPEHCDAKQIKKIADHLQVIFNQKNIQDKEKTKKTKKVALKHGGQDDKYERNNNVAMINDVMGATAIEDEAYGEYGDYGEEGATFKKADEAEFDFM